MAWARAGKGLAVGDLIFVEPDDHGGFRLRQMPAVNGALVAMEPNTGRVLAMVGGYSFSLSNFNRATQAYAAAGIVVQAVRLRHRAGERHSPPPASCPTARSPCRAPTARPGARKTTSTTSLGPLIFRRGLELSLNTMTVRIAEQVGMRKIVANAVKLRRRRQTWTRSSPWRWAPARPRPFG